MDSTVTIPEHPLPCAYDDRWAALKWAAAHAAGSGLEEWLNSGVDFGRVFVAGDSVGANIAHRVAMRNAGENLIELLGAVLVDPFFWGRTRSGMKRVGPCLSGCGGWRIRVRRRAGWITRR
ncbi:unnamed protein product [Linum trigynum]|uniref:Alpha/beta hydrolase fold-3 domain-containing protein n=1 Tax=Linum trigynum TaxID=586398 RepID=A0AAV2E1U7_9ROSI